MWYIYDHGLSGAKVNEEDHTRVISMEKGGNMKAVFTRFCTGLKRFEDAMKSKGMWCLCVYVCVLRACVRAYMRVCMGACIGACVRACMCMIVCIIIIIA